jgi:Flp pilus assembly protein TadD
MINNTGRFFGDGQARGWWWHLAPIVLLTLIPVQAVRAQGGTDITGTGGKHTIRGRIYFPSGRQSDAQTKIKLESTNSGGLSVIAGLNGEFSFQNLTPGSYTLSVDAGAAYEPYRESVFIDGPTVFSRSPASVSAARSYTVLVYLQVKQQPGAPGKLGVIDVALVNVPKQAADFYQKGLAAVRAGDSKKAVEELNSAVALFPDFPLALNELGVQYLKLGQPDKSAAALQSAVKLSPNSSTVRLNYGIALLNKKEFTGAEEQLRQALKLNDGSPTAHMYLGITLVNQRLYEEAEKELQQAVSTAGGEGLGQAHYYLGGLYWKKGDYKRAADELELYLQRTPNARDAERVRGTIKDLRAKS